MAGAPLRRRVRDLRVARGAWDAPRRAIARLDRLLDLGSVHGLLLSLGLLFPAGRLPTRRWRPYAVLVVTVCLAGAALVALAPGSIAGLGSVENPAGIEGLGTIGGVTADYLVQAALGALALATASSMFRRLLGARGEERQQLKWFGTRQTWALALSDDLVAVVRETMQPAHVSLWF